MHYFTLLIALLVDRYFGEPDWLWGKVRHPIVLFGGAIAFADTSLNKPEKSPYEKRRDGFVAIAGLLLIAAIAGLAVLQLTRLMGPFAFLAEAIFASVFIAQKSLLDHVAAVSNALKTGGVEAGRVAVAKIVGRDPATLDESAVSRAAIESLAENSSDGVIAPAFWFAIAGLPGLFVYKMLNTADSMIGHKSERYLDFGRAAAKLDDAANWIPSRLTGLLIVAAGVIAKGVGAANRALGLMLRDARLHRSPNAGWPEAAMAGISGLALAGPRVYHGDIANEPMLNSGGRRGATANDIDDALSVVSLMFAIAAIFVALLAIV